MKNIQCRKYRIASSMLLSFLFVVLSCSLLWAQGFISDERPPIAKEDAKPAFVQGQVVVKFIYGRHVESIQSSDTFEISSWENGPYGFTRLFIEGDVLEACTELMKNPDVAIAEPNYIRYLQITPNDQFFFRQDNLMLSNAERAWNIETGDASVTVAVIDTGVDTVHPDLKANLLNGSDLRDKDDDESDDSGHGTAVCGVVAAIGNNGIGVAGAAWNISILPLRACGSSGLFCSAVDEALAIEEAILQDVDIINLSLGGWNPSSIEESACNDAWDAGIILFAAAGNNGLLGKFGDPETEGFINYPAGYDNVIGVSSIDYPENGDLSQVVLSSYSNSGDAVTVTAVGSGVVTTAPSVDVEYLIFTTKADYGLISGTSFSTPLVSGMAAIIKSHFPNMTNVELRSRTENSVIDIGPPGWDNEFGYGLVDFQKALIGSTYTGNNAFNFGVTTNPILNDDVIVIVKVKGPIDGDPVISYSYTDRDGLQTGIIPIIQSQTNLSIWTGRFSTLFSGNITFQVNGLYDGGNLQELEMDYFKGKSN